MIANIRIRSNALPAEGCQKAFRHLTANELHSIHERCPMLLNHRMFASGGEPYWPDPARQWPQWEQRLFWGDTRVSMETGERRDWAASLMREFAAGSNLKRIPEAPDAEELMEWLCVVRLARENGADDSGVAGDTGVSLTQRLKDLDPSLDDMAIEARIKEILGAQ